MYSQNFQNLISILKKNQMKKYLFIFIGLCFSAGLLAQESNTTEFEVNGIKVIHKPSTKKVVSAKIFFQGGTQNYTKETEGIEALALNWVSQSGTKNYPKDLFNASLEKTGTSLSSSANYDYGTISLGCLTRYWDSSWEILADAVCNPSFDKGEFENIKAQMIANAQQGESDPDTHLRNTAMSSSFKGKPYERIPEGSPKSLEALTPEQAKTYYEGMRNTAKMFVVVVGDIDKKDLEKKISKLSDCVPQAAIRPLPFPDTKIGSSKYNEDSREIATNYVRGLMNAPKVGDDDEMAMRVAMSILGDHLWTEIRTKRNLSYAPGAYFPSAVLKDPYCILYVSTDKPNEAVQVMLDEIQMIRKDGFTEEELINKKGKFLTQYYMGQETNGSLGEALGKSEMTVGWEAGEKRMEKVNSLTLAEINTAFKKYATAIEWTYLGDTSIVDKDVFLAPVVTRTVNKPAETSPRNPPGAPNKKNLKKMKKNKKVKTQKELPRRKK